MADPRSTSRTERTGADEARNAVIRWAIAGGIGIMCAVLFVLKRPVPNLATAVTALMAIAAGWSLMLALAPWGQLRRAEQRRKRIQRMARSIRDAATGDDPRDSIAAYEDDPELRPLAVAARQLLGFARADRRESRMLQRTMDSTIQRETQKATVKLVRQATTDPLTGLGNRRALERRLEAFFSADRRRHGDTLAAMIIDLDLFKAINDTLGHDVGDQCLTFLGELLRSTLRVEDDAVRLGGDEFVALMPNVTLAEARAVADRVGVLFGQMPWPHAQLARPTLSIGVAITRVKDEEGPEGLLRRADEALYRSKRNGRDSVEVCDRRGAA